MPVTVNVILDEMSGKDLSTKMRPLSTEQNVSLSDLKDECRTILAEEMKLRDQELRHMRHFWTNGNFQPYKDREGRPRFVGHLMKEASLSARFTPDHYLVHLPGGERRSIVLDAEITVREALEEMHRQGMIRDVCCYEVLDARRNILEMDRRLWEQEALPYLDLAEKEKSLLTIRTPVSARRQLWTRIGLAALIGLVVGWGLHRVLLPHAGDVVRASAKVKGMNAVRVDSVVQVSVKEGTLYVKVRA